MSIVESVPVMKKGGGLSVGGSLPRGGKFRSEAKIITGSTLAGLGGLSFIGAPGNLGGVGLIAGGSALIHKGRKQQKKLYKKRAEKRAKKKYSGGQLKIGGGLSTGGRIRGRGRPPRPMTKPYYGGIKRPIKIQTVGGNFSKGAGFGKDVKQFFKGKGPVKPSSILYGVSGASTIASLNPAFAPVAAPIAGLSLGGARVAQAFGAGGKAYKPKKKTRRGRRKKKGAGLTTGGRIKRKPRKSSKYKSRI